MNNIMNNRKRRASQPASDEAASDHPAWLVEVEKNRTTDSTSRPSIEKDRHFRDLYVNPPDFKNLAAMDPDFAAVYVPRFNDTRTLLMQLKSQRSRSGLQRPGIGHATDQNTSTL